MDNNYRAPQKKLIDFESIDNNNKNDNYTFNRDRFLSNLFYMMKSADVKVGELEKEARVSSGYISRLGKSEAIPSVEFILRVANVLNTSPDTLLNKDISKLDEQEKYLLNFLVLLNNQTLKRGINWELQTKEYLDSISVDEDGNFTHPLFSYHENSVVDDVSGYPNSQPFFGFYSESFKDGTIINGDAIVVEIDDGVDLYIMNISNFLPLPFDNNPDLEIWLHDKKKDPYFLCGTDNNVLSDIIHDIYHNAIEYLKFPNLRKDTINIIDRFVNKHKTNS